MVSGQRAPGLVGLVRWSQLLSRKCYFPVSKPPCGPSIPCPDRVAGLSDKSIAQSVTTHIAAISIAISMNNTSKSLALAALAFGGLALSSASAVNPNFNYGDLVLGFQSSGGVGSGSYLFVNLGAAGFIRDFTSTTQLVNGSLSGLATQLGLTFGANWANRTDLFMGAGAIGSNDEFNGYFGFNDPDLTSYVSVQRQSVGTLGNAGSFAPSLTGAQTQDVANGLFAAQGRYANSETGSLVVISKTANLVDWDDQNPVSGTSQSTAINGVFASGIQTTFGAGTFGNVGGINAEAALDLYRIQRFNDIPGQFGFGAATDLGSYEGSILIDSLGNVSLGNLVAVPEPSLSLLVGGGLLGVMARRRRAATA